MADIALRKAYLQATIELQAMIERIVVDDQKVEMIGKKDRLLSQLLKATPNAPKPRAKVLSFARLWRANGDENENWKLLISLDQYKQSTKKEQTVASVPNIIIVESDILW